MNELQSLMAELHIRTDEKIVKVWIHPLIWTYYAIESNDEGLMPYLNIMLENKLRGHIVLAHLLHIKQAVTTYNIGNEGSSQQNFYSGYLREMKRGYRSYLKLLNDINYEEIIEDLKIDGQLLKDIIEKKTLELKVLEKLRATNSSYINYSIYYLNKYLIKQLPKESDRIELIRHLLNRYGFKRLAYRTIGEGNDFVYQAIYRSEDNFSKITVLNDLKKEHL